MDNKIKDIENKLILYKKELSDIVYKLANKRTELNTLAKQTIENIDSNIVKSRDELNKLDQVIKIKNNEILRLDRLIVEKNNIYNKETATVEERVAKLKELLDIEYNSKNIILDNKINDFNIMLNDFVEKQKQFDKLSDLLNIKKIQLEDKDKEILVKINNIEQDHNKKKEFISNKELDINNKLLELSTLSMKLDARNTELNKKEESLIRREKEANIILNKFNEIDIKKKELINFEETLKNKDSDITTKYVKLLSDIRDFNKRNANLENKELEIKNREDRVKFLEAEISKKL